MMRAAFTASSRPLVDAIVGIFETIKPPLTVRQVYYQLASAGLVPLSRKGYRQAQRLLLRVREEGIVPWSYFADRARQVVKPSQWEDVQDFADTVGRAYRRDLWRAQPHHVEIWLEKDAMSGMVADITEPYGVGVHVCRGFSSATFVHEAAAALALLDKPKFIYYLGDHDPSGLSIEKAVRERLESFGAAFKFYRLAVTLDDIAMFDLRPLEAKKTDSRYRRYVADHGTETIELDALPPTELRKRLTNAITAHIDTGEWERLRRVEEMEQETIRGLASRLGGVQ